MFDWYLKEWLQATDVSQADLSRLTDYPKAKVSDLVTGKQRYNRDILNDIAKALNIHPYELLMHPEDANSLKQIRHMADQIVRVPYAGTAGAGPVEKDIRKAG